MTPVIRKNKDQYLIASKDNVSVNIWDILLTLSGRSITDIDVIGTPFDVARKKNHCTKELRIKNKKWEFLVQWSKRHTFLKILLTNRRRSRIIWPDGERINVKYESMIFKHEILVKLQELLSWPTNKLFK